jgi:cystathionine beta-lyase
MGRRSRDAEGHRRRMSDTADDHPLADATRVVVGGRRKEWTHDGQGRGIVNTPVWRASTILYDDVAALRAAARQSEQHRLFYGRRGTPTQWSLAEALTALEPGAADTFLYPSGVAAIAAALMSVLSPGDELLLVDSAYDPTRSMALGLLKRYGITTRFYDPLVGEGIADLIGENTRAIFLESPGSLTFEVQDIPAIVAVAKARGLVTLLDNTWATPLYFPAMAHGIDLSILAGTKYVVGHSDVMMGAVTATAARFPGLRNTSYQLGQCVSPDDAWLGSRGLRTMAIRLARHQESALRIAQWLDSRKEVARVLHPALPSCPGHAHFCRDFKGSSGLFSFVFEGGDEASRAAFIDALDLFGIGYSWGGFESLAIPVDPARHRSATERADAGPLVRLQIGLEDADDLIADLDRGLTAFRSMRG